MTCRGRQFDAEAHDRLARRRDAVDHAPVQLDLDHDDRRDVRVAARTEISVRSAGRGPRRTADGHTQAAPSCP